MFNFYSPKIVYYHKVCPHTANDGFNLGIEPGLFNRQLDFFARHYKILCLSELLKRLEEGKDISGCVSITFDDGYKDLAEFVYPAAKRLGVKFALFIPASVLKDREYLWYDAFYSLKAAVGQEKILLSLEKMAGIHFTSFQKAFTYIKYNFNNYKIIKALYRHLGIEYPKDQGKVYLAYKDLLLMKDSFEYCPHSFYHNCFNPLGRDEIEQEIAGSIDYLSKLDGIKVNTQIFAYPFGRKQDMNNSSYEVLRQAGVKFSLSAEGGSIKGRPDSFFMPRIGIEKWGIWHLALVMLRF